MPVEQAKLLEGKPLAARIQEEIRSAVEGFLKRGLPRPCLAVLEVTEDPASQGYVNQQQKLAKSLGIDFQKPFSPADLSREDLLIKCIQELNHTELAECHGIFIAMPLPAGFDSDRVLFALDPRKDVEGLHPANLGLIVLRRAKLIPSTALAALRLIESTGMELRGKKAAVVGQSAIVGRPLQLLLGERRVTTIVCNTGTSGPDLQKAVSESDLVIACAGKPGLVKGAWIKPGAVVIDIGTTEIEGKLVGDVEFEKAKERAGFITPVPGGVGPLTVTMLMQNLIQAYQWQKGLS